MNRYLGLILSLVVAVGLAAGCKSAASGKGTCDSKREFDRYGMVIRVHKDKLERYKELHANPWKGVMDQLDRCNVRNFSIWLAELREDEYYLFGYLEYSGKDFDADMKKMGDDAETRRWWKETDPCQYPIETAKKGERWRMMEEVFFHELGRPEGQLMPKPKPWASSEAAEAAEKKKK